MAAAAAACPSQYSFRYNATLCACFPGRYMSPESGGCVLMEEGEWRAGASTSSVAAPLARPGALLGEVLPLDSVEKVVSSEAAVVKATLILVLFWLAVCVGVRFGRVDGGRTVWFRVRWWIARLDLRFSTKHQVCEAWFKKLRVEDSTMRDIRSQRRAQRNWDTLRKYVNYTWGHSNLGMKNRNSRRHDGLRPVPFCGVGSLHKIKQPSRRSSIYHDKMADIPNQMNFVPDVIYTGIVKPRLAGTAANFDGTFPYSECEHEIYDMKEDGERTDIASYIPCSSSWSSQR